MIAWSSDPEALGPPPPGVELVDEPGPEVEFAIPRWDDPVKLEEIPALRVVQVLSAGVDWIVDRVPQGVTLCSARGARDRAMAEWVVAAILADVKQARACAIQQGRREWAFVPIKDIAGLRVLVLGFGSIGRAVQELLAPFQCEVAGVARRARDGVHGMDELPELLGEADVVVNLLPLTDETRGSFGERELGLMRHDALYVNAGRGATTDTDALAAALQSGRIRAVLDVVEPEPLPPEHPLWAAPNVMISPHSAGDTPAAERAAWALAAKQLRRYAAGEELRNVVSDGY
ncbi:MAG TPA: NAD(P)-dependent oxidoreductase [Solirubrobacteraceae bacterium]